MIAGMFSSHGFSPFSESKKDANSSKQIAIPNTSRVSVKRKVMLSYLATFGVEIMYHVAKEHQALLSGEVYKKN